MAEPQPTDPVEQLRQHVESLRAAGIVWLPREGELAFVIPPGPSPEPEPAQPPIQPPLAAPVPPIATGGLPTIQLPLLVEPTVTSEPVPETLEGRQAALRGLAEQVAACTRCPALANTRTQTVFGVGRLDPDICFLGEAPGADEDRQGEPFVGAAGQLLTRIINACGMTREEVYICNILRCRPPGNRQPQPDEAANCRPFLERTLDLVRPRVICCLGATAIHNLLGISGGITRLRGRWLTYRGIPVMPTFHPAYLLRTPAGKKEVWEDMKTILTHLGRPVPGRG